MAIDVTQDFLSNLNIEKTMTVPALKGHLGGVDYFVITLSYSEIPRYVAPTDPNITDPRQRENRRPKKSRYADIATYMVQNPDGYRFSALTCTYEKNGTEQPIDWKPATSSGTGTTIGMLTLRQSDPLVIVDGQHRLGAIAEAAEQDPSLRDESIPIVLFPYISVEHAQQLFSDLNRNAKKTTKSLDILFDHRDHVNQVVQNLIGRVSFFGERVNMEDVSVPTQSSQVFTIAGIYQATKPVLEAKAAIGALPKLSDPALVPQYVDELADFWEYLGGFFPEWGKVARGELDIRQVRNQFLHWNSGVLSALGEFAGFLIRQYGVEWTEPFERAVAHSSNKDWSRASAHWQGIATAGTLVLPRSALRAQLLVYLKNLSGMELAPEEQRVLDHARSRV